MWWTAHSFWIQNPCSHGYFQILFLEKLSLQTQWFYVIKKKTNLARHEMFHRSISKFSKPENKGEKENYKEVICRERNNLYCY